MKVHGAVALLVLQLGCKGSSAESSATTNAKPTAPAPHPAEPVEQADADPDFTHVDRDQLAALCVAARLPPVSIPSDHGALRLENGERIPWVTVWVEEAQATALDEPFLPAKAWTARASAYIKNQMATYDTPPAPSKRTGREWKNVPCSGDEVFTTAITGVFFEKKAFHAVALRGTQIVTAELPTTTPREAVFRKAFELTEQLVGHSATIATHTFFGSGEQPKTVHTDAWLNAASKP